MHSGPSARNTQPSTWDKSAFHSAGLAVVINVSKPDSRRDPMNAAPRLAVRFDFSFTRTVPHLTRARRSFDLSLNTSSPLYRGLRSSTPAWNSSAMVWIRFGVTIEHLCNCGFGICNSRCNVSSGTTWSCDWLHCFQRFHTLLNFCNTASSLLMNLSKPCAFEVRTALQQRGSLTHVGLIEHNTPSCTVKTD